MSGFLTAFINKLRTVLLRKEGCLGNNLRMVLALVLCEEVEREEVEVQEIDAEEVDSEESLENTES